MRISNLGLKNNILHNVKNNYQNLNKVESQLVNGKRYQRTSQNPISTINSVYQKVKLAQVSQYQQNVTDAKGYIEYSHGKMSYAVNILQEIRELAVQASNGIYNKENREDMAVRVDELLKELVATVNSRYQDSYLYGGSNVKSKPYEMMLSSRNELGKQFVTGVDYKGNHLNSMREVGLDNQVEVGIPGNQVFWGENNLIISRRDSSAYFANQSQKIRIDGTEVIIEAGDDLNSVIKKINNQVGSVTASRKELPNGRQVFSLTSNYPHEMILEDLEGGQVFQELGMIREGRAANYPGDNIHPDTIQTGGSIFDVVMSFRDSLMNNDLSDIAGKDLASLDRSIDNLLNNQSKISATQKRLHGLSENMAYDEQMALEQLSKNEDMDIAEASVNFNELANIHRISLMTAAKLTQTTLMDYVR